MYLLSAANTKYSSTEVLHLYNAVLATTFVSALIFDYISSNESRHRASIDCFGHKLQNFAHSIRDQWARCYVQTTGVTKAIASHNC